MNIFGWRGQSKSNLKDIIVSNENLITTLRDEKIEAQISESRAQSGFNAQQEADRADHEVEVAGLKREITALEADKADAIEEEKTRLVLASEHELSRAIAQNKKDLRAEMGTEVDTLKKTNATLVVESAKNKGLYDGAVLVIASLQTQLNNANTFANTLVKALPVVSATITTPNPSVIVGSGNKS